MDKMFGSIGRGRGLRLLTIKTEFGERGLGRGNGRNIGEKEHNWVGRSQGQIFLASAAAFHDCPPKELLIHLEELQESRKLPRSISAGEESMPPLVLTTVPDSSEQNEVWEIKDRSKPLQPPRVSPEVSAHLEIPAMEIFKKRNKLSEPFEKTSFSVELNREDGKGMFKYRVSFYPNLKSFRLRELAMEKLIHIVGRAWLFNGAVLILPQKLPQDLIEEPVPHPENASQILLCAIKFIEEKNNPVDCAKYYSQLFKIALQKFTNEQMKQMIFSPQASPQCNLAIWAGMSVKSILMEGKIWLCVDSSKDILRNETAYDIYNACKASGHPQWRRKFEEAIVGQIVHADYQNVCGPYFHVVSVLWNCKPTDLFQKKINLMCHGPGLEKLCYNYNRKNHMSLVEYFSKKYNKNIEDLEQPLLAVRVYPKKNHFYEEFLCLVPQFCTIPTLFSFNAYDPSNVSTSSQILVDMFRYEMLELSCRKELTENWAKFFIENEVTVNTLKGWGLIPAKPEIS